MLNIQAVKAYYNLTKPGIIYSNVMTGLAGYLLGAKRHVHLETLLALLFGMALVIASACVFNNYIDRGIDVKMRRTKKRALVSGKINAKNALVFATVLGLMGFLCLGRINVLTFSIGMAAIFSYVVLYGIAKRKTVHGTLVGTVPGAASLVAGYTSATNRLDLAASLLFLIMLTWQMAHFYAIAIYRVDDYKAAKIPVMPAVRGIRATKLQIMVYIFTFMVSCTWLYVAGYAGILYLVAVLLAGGWWFCKGLGSSRGNDSKWARRMFGYSLVNILVLSAALAINSWLP